MAATRKSKPKGKATSKRKVAAKGAPKQKDPIGAALAAVRAGRIGDALVPLLDQWKVGVSASDGSTTEELADAIDVVARRRKGIPEIRGKTKDAQVAWAEVAERGDPADLGPLLEALTEVSSGDALKRLAVIARSMPDPRIDSALVELLHTIPYRATMTQPFWNRLFALLEQTRDRRVLVRLATATASEIAVTMGDWLRKKIAALRATLEDRFREAPAAADPRLRQLIAAIGMPKLSGGSKNLEALLQAIYDNPDDDGPRLVYADALLERGDPRGEFINLQIANSRALRPESSDNNREAKRREKDLLETHGKQWLGDLVAVIRAGYTFERGFLATCQVENRHMDRVRAVAGHPSWSTVRAIEGSATIALHPTMKALRRLDFVSYQARNHEDLPDSWRDLLIGTPRPLEALRYTGIETDRLWEQALEDNQSVRPAAGRWVYVPQAMELAAVCECSALPQLRELVLADRPDVVVEPILASAVIKRLSTLGFSYSVRNERRPPLEPIAAVIASAPVATIKLEIGPDYHTTLVDIERGARGYAKLTMTVGPTSRGNWSEQLVNEAIAILDQMPETLREVRITTRRNTDKNQFARLRTAVAQISRLDVAEVS